MRRLEQDDHAGLGCIGDRRERVRWRRSAARSVLRSSVSSSSLGRERPADDGALDAGRASWRSALTSPPRATRQRALLSDVLAAPCPAARRGASGRRSRRLERARPPATIARPLRRGCSRRRARDVDSAGASRSARASASVSQRATRLRQEAARRSVQMSTAAARAGATAATTTARACARRAAATPAACEQLVIGGAAGRPRASPVTNDAHRGRR